MFVYLYAWAAVNELHGEVHVVLLRQTGPAFCYPCVSYSPVRAR